jgi:hypothetical protein
MKPKPEREYQPHVIERLQTEFPGGIVMKNDAGYRQGYPDLIFTYGKTIHLETKRDIESSYRPNQTYYINLINEQGGFARTIRPENEDEVFKEIADYLFDCKIDILSFNKNYRNKYLK